VKLRSSTAGQTAWRPRIVELSRHKNAGRRMNHNSDAGIKKKLGGEGKGGGRVSGVHVRRCCEGQSLAPSSPARAAVAAALPLRPTALRRPVRLPVPPTRRRHPRPRLPRSSAPALVRPLMTTRGEKTRL
jgi:hypothetical protein